MKCVACDKEISETQKWKLYFECWKVAGSPKTEKDLLKNTSFVRAIIAKLEREDK